MKMKFSSKKIKFFHPPNLLREKVGGGGIEPMRLKEAQEYIKENNLDFRPYAEEIVQRLDQLIEKARSGEITGEEAVEILVSPAMELKANGGMFKYTLLTEVADVILNFLENITTLNEDAFNILDVHQKTLHIIIANTLKGDGGVEGRALANELYNACKRYYNKHGEK